MGINKNGHIIVMDRKVMDKMIIDQISLSIIDAIQEAIEKQLYMTREILDGVMARVLAAMIMLERDAFATSGNEVERVFDMVKVVLKEMNKHKK